MKKEKQINIIILAEKTVKEETIKSVINKALENKINQNYDIKILLGNDVDESGLFIKTLLPGFSCDQYKINWDKYGKSAAHKRNKKLMELGNGCIIILKSGENKYLSKIYDLSIENKLLVRKYIEDKDNLDELIPL